MFDVLDEKPEEFIMYKHEPVAGKLVNLLGPVTCPSPGTSYWSKENLFIKYFRVEVTSNVQLECHDVIQERTYHLE